MGSPRTDTARKVHFTVGSLRFTKGGRAEWIFVISVALPGCPTVYEGLEECAREALMRAIAVARAGR